MGKLILVPTPIGNLEDITLRALRVLKESDLILCEDTRTTGILLKHYQIGTKTRPFHKYNEHKTLMQLISLLQSGQTIALVSDAGTPSISDPGFLLVRECVKNNIEVECLPGAVALIPALVNSGFPTDRFCFEGFLPHKKGRLTRMKEMAGEKRTIVLYESSHRLLKSLQQLSEYLGAGRQASVSRELTKMYEETARGTFAELCNYFSKKPVKGEIAIVISPSGYSSGSEAENSE
ncbi:MAG: 16S rRNA (cytidine(1402)-2'-O)-methyltransferase [Bacteroidales bacterium]|nr:16S rRNA (cytidine(1402)-2'-O)-methyltransferase [Bacteroidales bacterium]